MRFLISLFFFSCCIFCNAPVFGDYPKTGHSELSDEKIQPIKPKEELTWGEFDPGQGMVVGRNELGSMSISFYALGRYLNQQPSSQSYQDHLDRKVLVDTRNDIELHRVLIWLKGNAYDPDFTYNVNFWTVNSTKNINLIGMLNYKFDPKFQLGVGVEGLPGVRSLNGQHPYFLGTDRHMGDEFFKPGFSMGLHARGQLSPNFFYRLMVGNALGEIGVTTADFTRDMSYGGSIWYLSTGEFGPRGGYGDYEMHSDLAARIGLSFTQARENGFAKPYEGLQPKSTIIKLSDGQNLYAPGALAEGVTVKEANYSIISPDMAFKFRGLFVDFNYYFRWLNGFSTYGGEVPEDNIFDHGTMVQVAKQVIQQKLEFYSAYTYIWGQYNNPWEIAFGANYYPKNNRNWRLNMMVNHLEQSPVSSQFGYYVGGQTGETIALATDVFF